MLLSLSSPGLASIAPISAPRHRRFSVSPPPLPKLSLLFASPLHKRSSSPSGFQLAASSVTEEQFEPEPQIEDDEDSGLVVAEEGDSGEGDESEEPLYEGEEEDEEEKYRVRMVLKFVWMQKNIGLGLERQIPGRGSIPLTPYYFWPRKDAWEELKTVLEERKWVSQKRMIILLNQATDIINLWQQSGAPTPTV